MSELVILRGSQQWSALYVDGKLVRVGDHYGVDEEAMERAGIKCESTDDFMRGGRTRADVASTLSEVEEYRSRRTLAVSQAAKLRAQAADLISRAEQLENPDND